MCIFIVATAKTNPCSKYQPVQQMVSAPGGRPKGLFNLVCIFSERTAKVNPCSKWCPCGARPGLPPRVFSASRVRSTTRVANGVPPSSAPLSPTLCIFGVPSPKINPCSKWCPPPARPTGGRVCAPSLLPWLFSDRFATPSSRTTLVANDDLEEREGNGEGREGRPASL